MPLTAATIDTNAKVLAQMSWGAWPRKMLWKKIVECKLNNQASVLEGSGHEQEAELLASYAGEVRADDSTGREAAGARRYFQALFGTAFVRAPHADATNNALDYGYSILLSHTACRIAAKGYLNQVGIHHHSKTNPYNLACDLMEPFRPLIDRKVELERPCELTPSVKRLLASTLADRIPYGHGSYRVLDAIDLWVDGCLRVMEGTGDADGISMPGMP